MIPLGAGPVPADTNDFTERFASGLRRIFAGGRESPLRVDGKLQPPASVQRLDVTLTGVEVSSGRSDPPAAFTSSDPGLLVALTITAAPVLVRNLPVTLAAAAENVPVSWKRAADDALWLVFEKYTQGAEPASARLDASAEVVGIERLLAAEVEARVRYAGFVLKSFSMDVRSQGVRAEGVRGLSASADVTVGKSFLSATVTVAGKATINDALILTISEVGLSSANPIVGALVGPVNAKLRPWNGRTIDLTRYTFAGAHLRSVVVTLDSAIRVNARFGG